GALGRHGPRQARRELHAARDCRQPQGERGLAARAVACSDTSMVETGHYALILAFALALVQSVLPLWGARTGNDRLMRVGGPVAITGFALMLLAMLSLMLAYVQSDFSVANVWQNSHSQKPLVYRITGTWGNHEGSMLLWVTTLGLFGALVA